MSANATKPLSLGAHLAVLELRAGAGLSSPILPLLQAGTDIPHGEANRRLTGLGMVIGCQSRLSRESSRATCSGERLAWRAVATVSSGVRGEVPRSARLRICEACAV